MLRIKEICSEKGYTLASIAETMGVSAPSLSSAINGNPTVGMLQKIATALGVPITELFESKGDFVAFVRKDNVTHTFDRVSDLKEFVAKL